MGPSRNKHGWEAHLHIIRFDSRIYDLVHHKPELILHMKDRARLAQFIMRTAAYDVSAQALPGIRTIGSSAGSCPLR